MGEFPAYFFSAAHAQSTGIFVESMSPLLAQKVANDGEYKKYIARLCAPVERIIADSKADWEAYEEKFRKWGMVPADAPYIPYLFTLEDMIEQQRLHEEYIMKRYVR